MGESVGQDASEYVGDTGSSIPNAVSERMLGWLVPHRSDHREAGIDRCLKDSEEYPQDRQTTEVVSGSRAHEDTAPD